MSQPGADRIELPLAARWFQRVWTICWIAVGTLGWVTLAAHRNPAALLVGLWVLVGVGMSARIKRLSIDHDGETVAITNMLRTVRLRPGEVQHVHAIVRQRIGWASLTLSDGRHVRLDVFRFAGRWSRAWRTNSTEQLGE